MFEIKNSALMEKCLNALNLRAEVISNNIANVDTPNFKSSKVVFEDLLNSSALKDSSDDSLIPKAEIVKETQTAVGEDGNNVDIDKENIELYRAQIQYEYLIRKLTDQYSNIKIAITGGKS